DGTHQAASAVTVIASQGRRAAYPAPTPGKQPHPQSDQQQRPEAINTEGEDAHRLHQEQDTDSNQQNCRRRNLGSIDFFASTKSLAETERVRSRLSRLNGMSGSDRVDDLVHVKKRGSHSKQRRDAAAVISRENQTEE